MAFLRRKKSEDLRGKWSDVFRSLLLILIVYAGFRWILWEPFVIPSGSMESTLLVQDYVFVKKWAYGVRLPFTEKWLFGPQLPSRGDIVVFKSVDETGHFLVKRVIGLPGDWIQISEDGRLSINGKALHYTPVGVFDEDIKREIEDNGLVSYQVQWSRSRLRQIEDFTVPPGHLFMMGDNRDFSADSRMWGPLPLQRIMGKLEYIWLSCRESETYSSFLCPAADFRWERMLTRVR